MALTTEHLMESILQMTPEEVIEFQKKLDSIKYKTFYQENKGVLLPKMRLSYYKKYAVPNLIKKVQKFNEEYHANIQLIIPQLQEA
jgi:hypothetical protein